MVSITEATIPIEANEQEPEPQEGIAKLFRHGRSQAVRLPKAFRLPGTEVRVRKEGDKVILEPLPNRPFDVKRWRAELRALGAADFLPEGVSDEDLPTADEISFD